MRSQLGGFVGIVWGQESGKLNFFWDGRDESGALVAPGICLYGIEIEAEEKNVEQFGTVAVVY